MFEYQLLIPKERVGALIGDKGKMKRLIERKTSTSLLIKHEEVTIKGDDSYKAWICSQVVKAVGRGFNPKEALKLIKEGYVFELINIMDYARNQKDKFRLRGRVIGENGKTKRGIEGHTGCKISVFGKTIGIIGPATMVGDAIEAVKMLLEGAQTNSVHNFLEKKAKMRVKKELI
ncbi:RNA-processing protein [archaeon]|nr:RNA-processing protein [archaeon]